ncbi:hypothetical protein BGW80DRAFT_589285 [Lactifluus volemus]|nr:hypothetical protein BGW80DRAFT_589285 [Lactifluus volemus]
MPSNTQLFMAIWPATISQNYTPFLGFPTSSARSSCGNNCRHLASSFPVHPHIHELPESPLLRFEQKCHIVVPGHSSKMCFRLRRSVDCHWTEERSGPVSFRGGTSSAQSLKAKGRLLCHIRKEVYLKGKGADMYGMEGRT